MVEEDYVRTLVMVGKRSAANLAWLEKRSCDLRTAIDTHGGGQLVSVAAPGQHVAYTRPMTLQDELGAVERALAIIAGQPAIVSVTYPRIW